MKCEIRFPVRAEVEHAKKAAERISALERVAHCARQFEYWPGGSDQKALELRNALRALDTPNVSKR